MVDRLVSAEEAIEILGGKSLEALVQDRVLQLDLQRLVEIVGEAARRVSNDTQERHRDIAWRDNWNAQPLSSGLRSG